jgi:Zn-dependent protease
MDFEKDEIRDLIISIIGLSILSGIFDFANSIIYIAVYALSTIARIAAQKLAAKKYDLDAHYNFNYNLFIISLVLAIVSFGRVIFPILGFVKISQKPIKRVGKYFSNITFGEKGRISLIGVLSNASLILVSLALFNLSPIFFQKMIDINILILLFSLIPFSNFDGSNILWWNRFLWIAVLACSMLFSFMAIFKINIIISLLFLLAVFILVFVMWESAFR